jgi:hypothetical protein
VETWRWRLGGGANAVEAHGAWWSALVSTVAYRAAVPIVRSAPNDPAPLAATVEALGPPMPRNADGDTGTVWMPSPVMLFALISALLLAEIASRRLRGAA